MLSLDCMVQDVEDVWKVYLLQIWLEEPGRKHIILLALHALYAGKQQNFEQLEKRRKKVQNNSLKTESSKNIKLLLFTTTFHLEGS